MTDDRGRRLGRGLSALFAETAPAPAPAQTPDVARATQHVPVMFLHPSRYQPRRHFDPAEIQALVESIKSRGILQPIMVRRVDGDLNSYEIIAGERRWRAAQAAQLHEVPIIVREVSDLEALEIALIENIQRQDLNPLEEAEGYRRLMQEFERTQEELAHALGKSRSHIANTVRLLNLPFEVRTLLDEGKLSAGHARALLNAADPVALAREVVNAGLNVRQTEALAAKAKPPRAAAKARMKDADTAALEKQLADHLGLKVAIKFDGQGGELVIRYKTLDQLDEVLKRLSMPRAVN
jgi:ParB family chromosome partitioning protein